MQRGKVACRLEVENGALIVHTTGGSRAVKITIGALHRARRGSGAIKGKTAERMARGEVPRGIDLENAALKVSAACWSRAVKIAAVPCTSAADGDWPSVPSKRSAECPHATNGGA